MSVSITSDMLRNHIDWSQLCNFSPHQPRSGNHDNNDSKVSNIHTLHST